MRVVDDESTLENAPTWTEVVAPFDEDGEGAMLIMYTGRWENPQRLGRRRTRCPVGVVRKRLCAVTNRSAGK